MEVEHKERAYTSQKFVPPKDLSEEDTSSCIQHIHKLIVDSQHLLPLEIYEKVFSVLELLKIWHDQKPELDRVHSDLDEAVRHFYTLFKDYCLLTRHEMRKHDLIAELTQSLGSITDQIEKLRAVSRIEEVTDNLEDLTIEPEDLPKIEYIENGILLMKSHFDGNKLVESETSDKFFRTAFTVLETISEKGLRVLAHKLKKSVFVDSTKVLETFIDYYLNHGVNSLFPVKLLKSILCSSKVHNFVKKFQKDRFTALFVKFYTSQSRLIHLDASVGIATFIRETYKDEQLVDLFERIDFARTNTVAYIKPLFEAFFGTNQSDDTSLRFIRTLIEAKKLQHLDNEIVGRDVPVERILKIINQYCLMRPKQLLSGIQFHNAFKPPNLRLKLGRRVFKGSCKDRFNHVLNLTFIRCVKAHFHSVPLKYQPMFVRVLYFAALDTPNSVQISESASEEDNTAVRKLANNLQKLWSYKILEINIFVWKKFYSSAGSLQTRSFRDCIDYLTTVVEHVTSVPQDRLSELESLTLKKGIQKSGKVAIQELIKHLFKGDNPFKWDVTSINDRVLYLYCFFKYPFESFVDWTKQLNSSAEFYSQEDMNTLFETFNEKKKRVIGLDNIAKYGYKYIQNNQLTTILAALEATSNGKHFFAKQGTGQGKSLTLALLALNFAKTGKRVMIFSCYDHLAKRDHAAFQQMYSDNRITSAYIEEANAEQLDAKVMYANLETFIRIYYSNTEKLAKGDEDGLKNFPIFGIDVILLDEFDALILDSRKIGNRVYDMSSLYSLGSFASAEEAKRSFKRKLSEVEGMRNFMNQGWTSQLINSWTGGFSDEEGHESTNYLGNRVCYVGGEWYELSKGNFYLYCSKIDVLSYLLSAPVLVGLSGSINEASMRMIRQTLTSINSKKEIQYLNVPNFYGIGASRNVAKTIQKNLSPSEWDTQIQRDLDSNGKDRPVLVFGNVNNPNQWNSLKSLLQNFAQENKRRFQIIDKEEQTTDIAMMHACEAEYITLATHIVGRGADFKIHPEIDAKGGLHVLITGIPNNDPRLYTQMIGRTARMTNQGSHSVILREALPPEDIQPINISSFHKQMNEVMSQVQGYLTSLPYSKENWRRWLLILNALLRTESWPVSGSTDSIALELARGVVDKHVNSALLQKFKIKNPQETANRRRIRSNEQQCIIA